MRTMWVIVIVVVILLIVFARYRSLQSDQQLNVDPAARQEIEKAKRR